MKKEITFEDLQRVNDTIRTTEIKGKVYAEVNQRIKAFRMLYPNGFIKTEMLSNENGICVFEAKVGYTLITTINDNIYLDDIILATGTAYEKEDSTFINKTSYIENCETSAVGRALGMCGFGIDTSVASAEEVQNAIKQQEEENKEASVRNTKEHTELEKKLEDLIKENGLNYDKVVELYKKDDLHKFTMEELNNAIDNIDKIIAKVGM